ncbi:MAG: PilT/PilU family type 4a pilus ATPase [Gammaproteobacteria bacterium]|nr:PilT/PilU family type 4a pilus ATPase [Gammaproteobacteria bacterium]
MDIQALLALMSEKKASDLFISVGKQPSIKVDGTIYPVGKKKLTPEDSRELILSAMSPSQRAELETIKEANFAISTSNVGRFRASAFIQRDTVGMVVRRIVSEIPSTEDLFLPKSLKNLVMQKRGLVLFVGATGTGKSTSLASLIKHRNLNSSGHIITIEDPLEYIHNHEGCIVTQREVGLDTESYEIALKNTLRQAPDVILIGEIRTRETMQHAITFAETGHLCLSTLHASNANQALDRILHFFPEEMHRQVFMDLSLNLRGIVAQQLVKRADGKGRYAAVEILLNTPLASDLIRKGEVHKLKELMKQSREQGMQTFDQHLYDLYKQGRITYEDALRSADSMNEVRLMIKLGDSTGEDPTNWSNDDNELLLVSNEE